MSQLRQEAITTANAQNDQQLKQAVIYCRTSSPKRRYDFTIHSQEKNCRIYAEKNGITILDIFHDSGTDAPPQTRTGFMVMCEYLSKAESPPMILVQDYFSISRDAEEITQTFKLLQESYQANICDIPAIDSNTQMAKFKRDANIHLLMVKLMDYMKQHEDQCAKFWEEISGLAEQSCLDSEAGA